VLKEGLDPITFELIKNSINSIIDEMALTMNRTGYSPLLRDLFDFATGLCGANGDTMGEGLVNPIHSGVFPLFVHTLRKTWGDDINPGDVFMGNDPYEGASHLPDVYTVRPVFIDGELVAFAGAIAHQLDFGGRTAGSNACDNIEIFQEGLRMPPLKYYDKGVRNYTLCRIIEKNVRISHMVIGDLEAQVAATGIGERKFVQLAQKYGGWKVMREYLKELLGYSERLTRAAIRDLPDGEYEDEDFMDDDGFSPDPIRFHVRIIVKGDRITFDLSGSSPKVKGSINLPLSSTVATVNTAIRVLLSAEVPPNAGVQRATTIIAPEGTVVNAGFPAGVAGRGATIGRLFDAIMKAMAKLAPDRVPACMSNLDFGVCLGGSNRDGRPFVFTDFIAGSWGGRPWADGIDAQSPLWLNYSNIPAEVIEREYPVQIEQYQFVHNSGGPGKHRGGLAMIRDYRILENDVVCQWRQDRATFSTWGLFGGKGGTKAHGLHIQDGVERPLKKEIFFCRRGDLLRAVLPGAGGWGDPLERDPMRVLEDVLDEKVSIEGARRDYGVVIDNESMSIDEEATRHLRKTMKKSVNYP